MDPSLPFRLRLFANPALVAPDGTPLTGRVTQRHRLALLARLARSPGAPVGREMLTALLWPESDQAQARNLLKVSVYVLRQALGDEAVVSMGDGLLLHREVVRADVAEFDEAMARGDHELAASLYAGSFMEGFFLKEAAEFEHWMERERARLAGAYARALEALAEGARNRGDWPGAVEWWKVRAAQDPYDSRVALHLMEVLVAAGSRAGALRHAGIHARLLRDELGIDPSAEIERFVERIRAADASPVEAAGLLPAPGWEVAAAGVETGDAGSPSGGETENRSPAPDFDRWLRRAPLLITGVLGVVVPLLAWGMLREGRTGADGGLLAEDIARAVVREMRATPVGSEASGRAAPTANVTAWELYQRASRPEMLRSDSAAGEALELARSAVALDSSFAGAHAALARLLLRIEPPDEPDMPLTDRLHLARHHATRATELDASLAEAHATLGIVGMFLYDFGPSEEQLKRSIELNPADGRAREWLVPLYVWMGRARDALAAAEQAVQVDPLSASARSELARALMINGRCEEALAAIASLRDLHPPLLRAGPIAAQCLAQAGRWDEAVSAVEGDLPHSGVRGEAWTAHVLGRAGRHGAAAARLDELRARYERWGEGAFWIALALAGMGDTDGAFEWLDRSVDDRSLTYEIQESAFSDLRADPRFERLLSRLGLSTP